ncbi:SDR family oxidoreductase [Fodinicurvata fenggangensis]|uniref:SDR family oxidoreductase n=1 Tax=Fodinicurvata fenggangensis TaxID=1121830 RepID=UPI00068C9CFF|nr:SDR family oxidoreductase [Fodinicurvata fenggangensis]
MKNAVITGAGQRLGHAMALALAERGYDLALHCHHSVQNTENLARDCHRLGRKAVVISADLSEESAAAHILEKARSALGPVHCLVNNAALYREDSLEDFTLEQWEQQLAINLRTPALLCQALVNQLPQDSQGCIINMLDQRVAAPTGMFFTYTLSKCGLSDMTAMLARSLAPRVRVNAIAPGLTLPSNGQSQAQFREAQGKTLLGTGPGPDDIVRALVYLLDSPVVTGETLFVDGGERYQEHPLDSHTPSGTA